MTRANLCRQAAGSRPVVEVRVQIRMIVMLHAEVLIAHTVIDRELGLDLELVLNVCGPVVIAIGTRERRRAGGQVDRASRSRYIGEGASCILRKILVLCARCCALGIDRHLKLIQVAGQKVLKPLGLARTKLLVRLGVGPIVLIHLDIEDLRSCLHRVTPLQIVHILVELDGILRAAGRKAAIGRVGVKEAG